MIGKSETVKKPVALAEAQIILENREKDGELGYEQKLALDHTKKFVGVGADAAKKMRKALGELGVSEATATKISDIMPLDITQLKHILVPEKKDFDESDIAKMMEIVDSHRGK